MEYQLPRLTKMWTHLERQAGGQVKGMGEKQIEVDKRILRNQVSCKFLMIIDKVDSVFPNSAAAFHLSVLIIFFVILLQFCILI